MNANVIIGNCLINLTVVDCHNLRVDPFHQQTVLQWLECIDYLVVCHNKFFLSLEDYAHFKNPAHHKLLQGKHFESWNIPFGA